MGNIYSYPPPSEPNGTNDVKETGPVTGPATKPVTEPVTEPAVVVVSQVQQPEPAPSTGEKRILITPQAKEALARHLLKIENENKNDVNIRTAKIEQSNIILSESIKALQEQNRHLLLENQMLAKRLEEYKSLYHQASKQIFIKN